MCQDRVNPCRDDHHDDGVPLDVDGGELGDGLSGFVVLRITREAASSATPAPVIPPPTTATSNSCSVSAARAWLRSITTAVSQS